jgi:hypothetical protein
MAPSERKAARDQAGFWGTQAQSRASILSKQLSIFKDPKKAQCVKINHLSIVI